MYLLKGNYSLVSTNIAENDVFFVAFFASTLRCQKKFFIIIFDLIYVRHCYYYRFWLKATLNNKEILIRIIKK